MSTSTVLKFGVEAGKDFFHLYDQTGKKGSKNKTGWGASPNTSLSEVKAAVVKIYPPKSVNYSTEVNVYPYIPNDECIGYELVPADLGLESFDPGIWKFAFEVLLHSGITIAEECWIFYYEPLKCCIEKKKANTSLLDASSDQALKVLELEELLCKARDCACKGNVDCAQKISDYIWTNCGCCC